ncbi:glutathione S-transferase 2-like isoform X1 [Cygnus atratus]|uniref:glutathione S-transferase 2-like isoform X1 n=1 Tax=Cygnus atratus TaxID=8868 RepID=UPI0015D58238|nr:glutathione S-transferase 2-like isoform X1 [Cygnus atratus]
MVVTLGYWDVRGLAHAIRLLLEHTETPYEERQYSLGPAPNFDPSDWTNEKEKLGLDFPNLPYLIDGSTKLTQSNAILRYIARKHNMCGETEEEKLRVDMLENQVMDLRLSFIRLCNNPDFVSAMGGGQGDRTPPGSPARLGTRGHHKTHRGLFLPLQRCAGDAPLPAWSWPRGWDPWVLGGLGRGGPCTSSAPPRAQEKLKPAYLEQLPGKLRELSRFLGSRAWFAGEKLTFVDFVAYDVLDQQRMFVPDCPELQGNLGQFLQRFEALEKIGAYMRSGRFMKTPVFWQRAQWCNKKE